MSSAADLVKQAADLIEHALADYGVTTRVAALRSLAASLREITPERVRTLRVLLREVPHAEGITFDTCETITCINARAALESLEKIVGHDAI